MIDFLKLFGKKKKKEKLRNIDFVLEGFPCDVNFYPDGPFSIEEATKLGPSPCPHKEECEKLKNSHNKKILSCVMCLAVKVAREALKTRITVADEIKGNFKKFFDEYTSDGYIWSEDRKNSIIITNKEEAIKKIEDFAVQIVGTREPRGIGPSYHDVMVFATTKEGIDLRKIELLKGRFGGNCDAKEGPCSCGAWH